jgi:purine-binding chemotaxis protein CheW
MNTKVESNDLLQLVTFTIGNEKYGIDILRVQEIMKMVPITGFPDSPEAVEGIINLRGNVILVIDLRTKMHLERKSRDGDSRIIVVETGGRIIGIIVDSVWEVLRIPESITEPVPALASGNNSRFVRSIGRLENGLLLLLELDELLADVQRAEVPVEAAIAS